MTMAIRADSTDTTIVPHRVMAELHPRDVLADLLGSGDFPVEIADPEAAAQLILDRLEGAGFVVIKKKSAYRGAHAYQAIETPVREVSKMAEIAMRLAIEVDCETEQFDLTLFTIGKTLELAQRLNEQYDERAVLARLGANTNSIR
jgi:hypothetical protein